MKIESEKSARASTYPEAVRRLEDEFSRNRWFIDSYWPENEPRVRLLAKLALENVPVGSPVLEVGCANGYLAYLMQQLGYQVTAVDAYDEAERDAMFRRAGVKYQGTNLNNVAPLSELLADSFDLVLLGEVFEHILNQPVGLLEGILRLLKPGGLFVLTTPNPSSLANAIRLVRDNYVLWGTDEFLRETKLDGGRIIDRGDIHYREYPARIVRDAMVRAGFRIAGMKYVQMGVAPTHSAAKRWTKRLIQSSGLGRLRLFSPGYAIWATKPV